MTRGIRTPSPPNPAGVGLDIPALNRRAFIGSAAVSVAAAAITGTASAQNGGTVDLANPAVPGRRRERVARMSFLENAHVKLGIDLSCGGAITYLEDRDRASGNMINSFDLGRQIQMSYYSGPVPYRVPGHAGPRKMWEPIGWNPIQVGDDFGNSSRILAHTNDGREIYVKCIPMQWPLDGVPGECTFESWIRLEGNAVRTRCRLMMTRADKTQWPARDQELPAVYTNGPWYDLVTYRGDRPFTGDALAHIEHPFTMDSPWAHWTASEQWAALVDRNGHGLGVWSPGNTLFSGGFFGDKGKGGTKDAATGYIAPNRVEVIDHDIVHDYRYALICGDVPTIRKWVYDQPRDAAPPSWVFAKDRQGWSYVDAVDGGWPIKGRLDIRPTQGATAPQIVGPMAAWQASEGQRVTVRGAFSGEVSAIRLLWRGHEAEDLTEDPAAMISVHNDGRTRDLVVDLSRCAGYRGLITQLRIDPVIKGSTARIVLDKISVG